MDLWHFWMQFRTTHKKASLMNIPQSWKQDSIWMNKDQILLHISKNQKKVTKRNHPSEHVHIGVTFKFPSIPWNPSWTPPQVLWRGACKPDNVQGSIKQKEHGSAEVGSGLATRGAEESREMAWVLLMNLSAFSFPHCGWGFQRARSGHALKQPEKQNG